MTEIFELWENGTTMTYYKPENKTKRAAVVIFPGGGYWGRAEHEGKGYADFLNQNGITAFVVDYRVHPNRFPLPLLDARRAMRYVRHHADKFGIDKDKIAAMGSSAGGHLVSILSTYHKAIEGEGVDIIDNEKYLPDKQILCYPVINLYDEEITHIGSGDALIGDSLQQGGSVEKRRELSANLIADENTPEAFIWHTFADELVNVQNTLEYATRLRQVGVCAEVHIYPYGKHGLGLANEDSRNEPHVAQWGEALIKFSEIKEGIKAGIPIALGYFSVSVAFGVSTVGAGVPWWGSTLISLTNLTSAGQKAGVDVMAVGGSILLIVLTTLIINMRYFLMGVSMSQKVEEKMPLWQRLLVAFGITDEIYAVSMGRKCDLTAPYMAGLIIPPIFGWTGGTLVGSVATNFMPEILAEAMGIALYGMFIAVIVPPSKKNIKVLCAVLLAIGLSVIFTYMPYLNRLETGWAVIIITIAVSSIAATLFPVKEEADDE